jgi:predicted esterase
VAQSQCFPEASAQLAATPISALLAKPLSTPEFAAALRETLAVPVAGYDRPLFVAHGLADTTVPVPLALKFAGDLVANGVRFDFRTYPTSHSDTMQASLPDSLPFVARALR